MEWFHDTRMEWFHSILSHSTTEHILKEEIKGERQIVGEYISFPFFKCR
jgi:hypothetical protein